MSARAIETLQNGAEARTGRPSREAFSPEQAAAVESPREFRLSPDGRRIAFTSEYAGARQIFLLPVRGGFPEQLTASEQAVSDPQWSPDGRRIAFVRENAIWLAELDGSRQALVTDHPAGNRSPRWCPDGRRIAFISRRRGWDQLWVIEAPVPRRGRPSTKPRSAEPRALTAPGVDVDDLVWSPDGRRIAFTSERGDDLLTSQVHVVDVASCAERQVGGRDAWETGPRWLPDGSGLLLLSDADGWFQVALVSADGAKRVALTSGQREHGTPDGGWGYLALPSPDGTRFVHTEVHDGLVDLVIAPLPGADREMRDHAGSERREIAGERSAIVNPYPGVWMAVDWLPDSTGLVAIGESERAPEDVWILPVPELAAEGVRPRQLTRSLPLAVDTAHFAPGVRVAFDARDGRRIEGTLYLPSSATGEPGSEVPCVVHSHGGPTAQAFREWFPFRELAVQAGIAFLSIDYRGSTGYGRDFRCAIRGEWGHADVFDVIDGARWAAAQAWCDGRLACYGASYGGYLTLCALVEEPSLWRAGIDMYGDSEIAESYRHGDRLGRIDLERWMGRPDDPAAAELYRRGSPVYRAERIEAPLLIMHGRKDKRVVPLMTEKMVEALEIEGKHYQVHWYDDEAHGWRRRENRRDAWKRSLDFLKRHLLDQPGIDGQ